LISAIEGNFKQAITDLTTCISLDESFDEAYIERAKSYMLENELMLAYSDFEQVSNNKHWIATFFIHNNEIVCLRLGKWNEAGVSGKLCAAILSNNVNDMVNLGINRCTFGKCYSKWH
jgi:hypothetical protein